MINIFKEIGGSDAAVASEDGENLFRLIMKGFKEKITITLDFNNIHLITSTFLNAAIGQLYGKYDSDFIRKHLKIAHMAEEDMIILKKVVERAKEYFEDKAGFEASARRAIGNE